MGELTWIRVCSSKEEPSPFYDDLGSIESVVVNMKEYHQMTLSCIRTLLNSFFVMYRLLHLETMCTEGRLYPNRNCTDSVIHRHHVSASADLFYKLSMYHDLHPGARLNYRHTFSGLYNCISQPVYFHNPDYQRRVAPTLETARACKSDIDALPALLQLYPEVEVVYDDEKMPDIATKAPAAACRLGERDQAQQEKKSQSWRWLLTAGKVYLVKFPQGGLMMPETVLAREDCNIARCLLDNYVPG